MGIVFGLIKKKEGRYKMRFYEQELRHWKVVDLFGMKPDKLVIAIDKEAARNIVDADKPFNLKAWTVVPDYIDGLIESGYTDYANSIIDMRDTNLVREHIIMQYN
jgi:hypothetical protein